MTSIPDDAELKDRIRHARQAANMSQIDASEQLGVHQGTWSAWETGETKRISQAHLKGISRITGFPFEWLRDGGKAPAPQPHRTNGDRPALRPTDVGAVGGPQEPFVVGVRAITETMRRQIEALDHLIEHDERAVGIHEMLRGMMRQVGAVEILLLGSSPRAGGVSMDTLLADIKAGAADAARVVNGPRDVVTPELIEAIKAAAVAAAMQKLEEVQRAGETPDEPDGSSSP